MSYNVSKRAERLYKLHHPDGQVRDMYVGDRDPVTRMTDIEDKYMRVAVKSKPLDIRGLPVNIGDIICYALARSSSAHLNVYKVLDYKRGKVRDVEDAIVGIVAQPVDALTLKPNGSRVSHLSFTEGQAIVISQ